MSNTMADQAILNITGRAADLAAEKSAVQFDWGLLILPVFDLLSQLLMNCTSNTNRERVAQQMQQPGFYRDRRLWQAIRKAEREQGLKLTGQQRQVAFLSMRDELDASHEDAIIGLLDELQADEAAADWSILG
jgi:hypothetical protein